MSENAYRQSLGDLAGAEALLRLGLFSQQHLDRKTPLDWIIDGSDWEDSSCCLRPLNHFYDPTTGFGLLNFSDLIATNAVNWALEMQLVGTLTQNWSLRDARSYYYSGLTDSDPRVREASLAKTFRALGQVIHLIQDMAQPQHVRDDPHYETEIPFLSFLNWDHSRYEEYTLRNQQFLRYTGYAPVDLPDAISYWDGTDGRGLAEVTNQNFFSERDTITCSLDLCGESGYQHPTISLGAGADEVETLLYADGSGQSGVLTFFPHTFADPITNETVTNPRVLTLSLFDLDLQDRGAPLRFSQNPFTFEESQKILIPRAVGYSAGLINQFFRNDIEITPPERFVYGITTADGEFTEIRLKARNITSTGDPLSGGTIQLVVTYRQALEDPYRANLGGPVPTSAQATTIVVPVANSVTSIPSDTPVELVFNLSDMPLPQLITDLYVQVVYKGTWGTESDAVVVGYNDFSEPTPIDVINTMDYVCLSGQYLVAGSAEAVAAGDLNSDGLINGTEPDVYAHGLEVVQLRFSSVQSPEPVSDANYTVRIPSINPAQYARMVILTEPEFTFSSHVQYVNLDSRDQRVSAGPVFTVPMRAVKNQREVIDGQDTTFFSVLSDLRTLPVWFGAWYGNRAYPDGTACAESAFRTATPDLTGPVLMEIR
jgi:hypothetical protein